VIGYTSATQVRTALAPEMAALIAAPGSLGS